jgi:Lar family restriction alleviation protein
MTNINTQTMLLPCPFCGGPANLETGHHNFDDAQICCQSCGMYGPVFDDDIMIGGAGVKPIPDAIKHWNTRSAAPAPPASKESQT